MTDDPDVPDWFAGIDWASEKHQVALLDGKGKLVAEREVPHTGAGLAALAAWLFDTTGTTAERIAVAIEVPHGPVVETLLERGFRVYAINPKQLDRFRDRFTLAGAKDDRRDAWVLGDSLRTDRNCFRLLRLADPTLIELREWSRMTDELQAERARLANRVREQLWRYYPQALALTDDLGAEWFLALWALAPTPAKAMKIHKTTLARLLQEHRIRRLNADQALAILRQPAFRPAAGTTEAATAHIRALVARLRLLNRQLKDAHHRLDALCASLATPGETEPGQPAQQRDATILQSLPGVGRIVLATLLAEAAEPLRQRDYHALRSLCGVAPVTQRSGKRCVVIRRLACHVRLREAVYHWARTATQRDPRSQTRYQELRRRGHSHGRALRTVGDRLLNVACAMLRSGTLFDPARQRPIDPPAEPKQRSLGSIGLDRAHR